MASHATTSATELLLQRHHQIEDLGADGDQFGTHLTKFQRAVRNKHN